MKFKDYQILQMPENNNVILVKLQIIFSIRISTKLVEDWQRGE